MGYQMVYRSLKELFPQIDSRILKAVAIEHPKDADEAAAVVISDITPKFDPYLPDISLHPPGNKDSAMPNGALTDSQTSASSSSSSSSSSRTTPLALDTDHQTELTNGDLHIQSKAIISPSDESRVVSSDPLCEGSDQAELSTSADSSQVTQKPSRSDDVREASLTAENSDAELDGAFSSIVTQGCKIDHLQQIIEDAKSNKRTLFTVMESIMNLMREVEIQEKDAEKVKEDAARGGFDTLQKVEDLKKILAHAKEGNDMDAGEVYGEKSILTSEVNELENRLLNLSEERDKSLSVLDEMRGVLEMRLAAALEIKNAAEQEKQEKEGYAQKALAEQEAIMEKVVQESKLLQKEAEENSKLREFLMDRGRIVDSLQGEIFVICQDIRILKEKFDNRVPLSQSVTSSQTSCKLASSGSSMKSLLLEKPLELSYETPEASSSNKSPKALVEERKDERKELLEDGWDIFDKETKL
ncbi:PREDICTED: myosin heavy chain, non-muscle-like isoform X2 [Brassica oleracea var. oleracea]|uniref:CUE domain-containing protein n=1 Tax=Brassica oleracea var. oleracea TaxID=109376 RepID=A0A0D3ASI2_BRAOL|nr:PREDICTED: myosin heavy chain, non-muscle-like isoform X2 [Brassica oleracea var. oleracea]